MFYLKHACPSHSSSEYVLVQTIQISTSFLGSNQLRLDLVSMLWLCQHSCNPVQFTGESCLFCTSASKGHIKCHQTHRLLRKNTVDVLPKTRCPLTFVQWIRLGTDDTSIYFIFSVKLTTYRSRLVLHVTCDMLHVKCYVLHVTCDMEKVYYLSGNRGPRALLVIFMIHPLE